MENREHPVFESPVIAGQPPVTKKLELQPAQARSEQLHHPAMNGRQRRLAPPEWTPVANLATPGGGEPQHSLHVGMPEAQLVDAGLNSNPERDGEPVRTGAGVPVAGENTAADANATEGGQAQERSGIRNPLEAITRWEAEAVRQSAARLDAPRPGQGSISGSQPDGRSPADPVSPQPMASPVFPEVPLGWEAAAQLGLLPLPMTAQTAERPSQLPAEASAATEAASALPAGQTPGNGVVRNGAVHAHEALLPNSKSEGSPAARAAEAWSGKPERGAGVPLWSSELAFAARLAEPADAAASSSGARSIILPGARPQATELLENGSSAQPRGESLVATRSGLADEAAPRRQIDHTSEAVVIQPLEASNRLVADWSGTGAVGRQEPCAESGESPAKTSARSLRAADSGAGQTDRLPQVYPGGAVRELRVRVADAGVEVRLSPGGRELHVAVRSPQPELREALRGGLDELASHLAERGLEAQIWRPAQAPPPGAAERGWEASRSPMLEGGEAGAGRRGQPDQQPPGDGERRQPDPRWAEVWSEREGEGAPRARGVLR
ncbi:MAG: flagellar hook-length control protein FliK [Bryobacteraceae bacterium]